MQLAHAYQSEALTLWETIVADIKAELLETEKEFGDKLISKEEIDIIESTWAEELLQKVSRQHLQQAVAYA